MPTITTPDSHPRVDTLTRIIETGPSDPAPPHNAIPPA